MCKMAVKADAIKCRYCHSMLKHLEVPAPIPAPDHARQNVVYVVDRGLILFAKVVVGILVVMIGVSLWAFGLDLWTAHKEVKRMQDEVQAVTTEVNQTMEAAEKAEYTAEESAKRAEGSFLRFEERVQELAARARDRVESTIQAMEIEARAKDHDIGEGIRLAVGARKGRRVILTEPVSTNQAVPSVEYGSSVHFDWQHTGYVVGEQSFQLQISTSGGFESPALLVNQALDQSYFECAPEKHGCLYWRVALVRRNEAPRKDDWSEVGLFEFYENGLARIRDTGQVLIGTTMGEGNLAYVDADKKLKGFDVDLAGEIVRGLGRELGCELTPRFVGFDWSDLFAVIQRNRVDFIIAGITKTDERERKYGVSFTRPYFHTHQAAIWLKTAGFDGVSDTKDRLFVVQRNTRGADFAALFTDRVKIAKEDRAVTLMKEILEEGAEVGITDHSFAVREAQENGWEDRLTIVPILQEDLPPNSPQKARDDYALAVARHNSGLLVAINQVMKGLEPRVLPDLQKKYSMVPDEPDK